MKNFLCKKLIVVFMACSLFFVIVVSGCTNISEIYHTPQLSLLKAQPQMVQSAKQKNQMFDELIAEIQEGEFNYQTADQVFSRFGQPAFSRQVKYEGKMREHWLYQYSRSLRGDRVHMYFDENGQLLDADYFRIKR